MKGVRNVRTRIQSTVAGAAIVLAVMLFGAAAEARTCVPTRPALHVESLLRTLGPAPAVEGFFSNEEILRLSNVRLRVDVVDVARVATEEAFGWIFGDLAPGGRGYFVVSIERCGADYRVSVLSFDVDSRGGATGERIARAGVGTGEPCECFSEVTPC